MVSCTLCRQQYTDHKIPPTRHKLLAIPHEVYHKFTGQWSTLIQPVLCLACIRALHVPLSSKQIERLPRCMRKHFLAEAAARDTASSECTASVATASRLRGARLQKASASAASTPSTLSTEQPPLEVSFCHPVEAAVHELMLFAQEGAQLLNLDSPTPVYI